MEQQDADGRDLRVAIAIGVLLAGLFIGSVVWHPAAFSTVVAVFLVIAGLETGRVLADAGHRVDVPVVVGASVLTVAATYVAGAAGQAAGVAALFGAATLRRLVARDREAATAVMARTLFLGLWTGLLASYGVLLVTEIGAAGTLLTIGAAVFADIGGFGFGSLAGRTRIAPRISPNKTWEGLVGGVVLAMAVAVLVIPRMDDAYDPLLAAAVAGLAGLAGVLGDLLESMVKRDVGVKDLGDLLPGHGGILDRVDGLLLAMPVGYYALEALL